MSAASACPDDLLEEVLAMSSADSAEGLGQIGRLLQVYGTDSRLHFLQGSLFASDGRISEADQAMAEAVRLEPQFHLARFQLGLLRMSSGDVSGAEAVWLPLAGLPSSDPLRLFSSGLVHFAQDEWAAAAAFLSEGIACNQANPSMNDDMEIVLRQAQERETALAAETEASAAQLLLNSFVAKGMPN